jgi:hypothetical protein
MTTGVGVPATYYSTGLVLFMAPFMELGTVKRWCYQKWSNEPPVTSWSAKGKGREQ